MLKVEAYRQYNTIDIDTNDKETVKKILNKIIDCYWLGNLLFDFSLQKGVHIKLFCKRECELCRLAFDDNMRYSFDNDRVVESRNVLFDTKEFYRGGKRIC